MTREVVILLAEDDDGHARLVEKNLARAGVSNRVERFRDGAAVLEFLHGPRPARGSELAPTYVLLLDVRLPQVGGVEVLRRIKEDPRLRLLPVSMLTTTDDPREIERCYALGCSHYLVKPVDYEQFADLVRQLGLFLQRVEVPAFGGRCGLAA